jgi:hypothetical protein
MAESYSPQAEPKSTFRLGPAGFAGVGLLVVSAVALLLAPTQMPDGYSWLRHTTSESAAQGVRGAWLARLGFLIFGLAVIGIANQQQGKWTTAVRWLHGAFGVLMVATAAFSTRSWLPDSPYDPVEDALHSFTATFMGFAFAIGVALRLRHRGASWPGRAVDLIAILAAVAIPLTMGAFPQWDGLLQRGMFAIAYVWYGFELLYQGDRGPLHETGGNIVYGR